MDDKTRKHLDNLRSDEVNDDKMRKLALGLIETEDDLKYRKKYASVWK